MEKANFKIKKINDFMKPGKRMYQKGESHSENLKDLNINICIYNLAEKLDKYELLALCQSYCSKDLFPQLNYNLLIVQNESISFRTNLFFYLYLSPLLRDMALNILYKGITEKMNINTKVLTWDSEMDHTEFNILTADYLSFEIDGKKLECFEEHMLACDACANQFLLKKDIVKIIKEKGRDLLLNTYLNSKEENMIDDESPMNDIVLLSRCIVEYISELQPCQLKENISKKIKNTSFKDFLSQHTYSFLQKKNQDHNEGLLAQEINKGAFEQFLVDLLKTYGDNIVPPSFNSDTRMNRTKAAMKDINFDMGLVICLLISQISFLNLDRLLMRFLPILERLAIIARNV